VNRPDPACDAPRGGRADALGDLQGPYELLDFGGGRKLESLAGYVVDRPSPAAAGQRRAIPALWSKAAGRFEPGRRGWTFRVPFPEALQIDCGAFAMPVAPTPSGHLGIFPEQAANWEWLARQVQRIAPDAADAARLETLNLFAYTGASSLALAAAGAKVSHVDAARPNVQGAKRAAAKGGLEEAPIRYLVDDARQFVRRELRRGRRYRLIALDPPAYGHGPKGNAWRLERDLWPLLEDCLQLLGRAATDVAECPRSPSALLLTGHSETVGPAKVADWLRRHGDRRLRIESGRAELSDRQGRRLDAGFYLRITWD
jgi:23S rRNA (cytosine1962-C5)-methyltransferase